MSNGEWSAIGQGKANIVFGYIGSDPRKYGMVFRVRKLQSGHHNEDVELEKAVWSEILSTSPVDSTEASLQFTRKFILPKLGTRFIETAGGILATPRDLSSETELASMGLLLRNYTLFSQQECRNFGLNGSTFCLEIKPKCGFLPTCQTIHLENKVKKKKTRFALQQRFKLIQKKITEVSKYCPLDLFSRNEDRMWKALQDLLSTPQNNLKLFLDGKPLPITKSGFFNPPVAKVLESIFDSDSNYQELLNITVKILQTEDILDKILDLQLMDQYDIEGVYPLYCSLKKQFSDKMSHHPSENDTQNLKKHPRQDSETTDSEIYHEAHSKLNKLNLDEKLRILREYLIALSAKDCSIYLTFQVLSHTEEDFHEITQSHTFPHLIHWRNELSLVYKIQVGDLDPKKTSKIPYQHQLDKKILLTSFKK